MKRPKKLALRSALAVTAIAAAGLVMCRPSPGAEPAAEAALEQARGAWRRAPVWDDGNAEFCAYEVSWRRYGELYDGRALLILVKEPWAPDLDVKADEARPDGFDVLKLNHVRDVATGVYTYHQMASVYLRRDDGALRKLAAMSSEGCGLTTAWALDGSLETRSYFDGQGETRRPYPPGALPEDGLPAMLRDFLEGAAPAEISVLPTLLAGRLPEPEPVAYRLSRRAASTKVPAGAFETIELELAAGERRLTYAFDREPPHLLVRHTRDDGTTYELAKCERIPYWTMNRPGDESWLPESVR